MTSRGLARPAQPVTADPAVLRNVGFQPPVLLRIDDLNFIADAAAAQLRPDFRLITEQDDLRDPPPGGGYGGVKNARLAAFRKNNAPGRAGGGFHDICGKCHRQVQSGGRQLRPHVTGINACDFNRSFHRIAPERLAEFLIEDHLDKSRHIVIHLRING